MVCKLINPYDIKMLKYSYVIIKNDIYLLCKHITEDQKDGDQTVKHKELTESIAEYKVSCLGPKAESCIPPPGVTFEDIKDQGSTHVW